MNIERILDTEYNRLRQKGVDRFQVYANIIAVKREYGLEEYHNPLYVDIKRWIRMFFEDVLDKNFGYDSFRLEPFAAEIDQFPLEQSLRLYFVLLHHCVNTHYNADAVRSKIEECRIRLWKEKHRWCRIGLYKIANNGWLLTGVCLIYLVMVTLCMLPAPFEFLEVIQVRLLDWSVTSSFGGFLRYLGSALYYIIHGATDETMILPLNIGGVILIGVLEFVFWGLIINFLYQKVIDKISATGFADRDSIFTEEL